jgi:luciferase family oxidoreductase group 1
VPVPLSVLDLTPVPTGAGSADAVANTVDLARHADALGYRRIWLAEHHNTPGMACPAPEVMIGHVASATRSVRVGSGGVMLPNHSPLRIAETYRLLEALHPGRIDLGIGRAPGTDGVTAHALRRGQAGEDFPGQLAQLFAFARGGWPDDHPYAAVTAQPADVPLPPVWILGSSEYGAQVAAALGLGFAFARHLNPRGAEPVMGMYRAAFRPSEACPEPYAILTVSAVCAGDRDEAEWLASSLALGVVRMRQGRPGMLPSPEEAAAHAYTPDEADQVRRYMRAQVLGDPAAVREQLDTLVDATGADEVMVMTSVHDHATRLRSYRLIAEVYGRTSAAVPAL